MTRDNKYVSGWVNHALKEHNVVLLKYGNDLVKLTHTSDIALENDTLYFINDEACWEEIIWCDEIRLLIDHKQFLGFINIEDNKWEDFTTDEH